MRDQKSCHSPRDGGPAFGGLSSSGGIASVGSEVSRDLPGLSSTSSASTMSPDSDAPHHVKSCGESGTLSTVNSACSSAEFVSSPFADWRLTGLTPSGV